MARSESEYEAISPDLNVAMQRIDAFLQGRERFKGIAKEVASNPTDLDALPKVELEAMEVPSSATVGSRLLQDVYMWPRSSSRMAHSLLYYGWTVEARCIFNALDDLPTEPFCGENHQSQIATMEAVAHRVKSILTKLRPDAVSVVEAKSEQEGPWSKPDSPSRWAIVFDVCPATFKTRVKEGKIRAKILSDRSYRVHLEDLPKGDVTPGK